ncbi:MAG: SusD/RagB family nutrient-binding outer membrane lipoprotein [Bacteroidales bacterium]|nr:SusD/RagB family nutrient-binding outer membrane lipoprotein [Candidatus Equimonas faecalis]
MKKTLLYIALACAAGPCVQSCMDFDEPGDELGANEVVTDHEVYQNRADSLKYRVNITPEGALAAFDSLSTQLQQCKTGIYGMRGGKDGGVPEAHSYQFQYNLETDAYAGYLTVSHKDYPYSNATQISTYNYCEQFNAGPLGGYGTAKNAFAPFINNPKADSIPEVKAIYLLYYSLIAQECADLSGPFTYTEDKNNSQDPTTYEPLSDIYPAIVENIDSVLACLHYYENRSPEYKQVLNDYFLSMNEADNLVYADTKDMTNYIRLANSLKLRMAMHIVKVKPDLARKWAEEAVKDGVVEKVAQQQGIFPSVIGFTHPLVEIANSWNDTRLCASFESLLMSLDHPYTKYLFKKNGNPIPDPTTGVTIPTDSMIVGIRAGVRVGTGQSYAGNTQLAYSSISAEAISSSPLYFISLAEVNFLRAEGALRGWQMGGEAEHFYNEGIRYSYIEDPTYLDMGFYAKGQNFNDYVEDYMKRTEPVAYVQHDPLGQGPDWPSLTKIGVAWNGNDSPEIKLEKIITQKYIALFPNSQEAWTELRRTGYPKLFPVLNPADGDGSLNQGDLIRRIPWASTDPQQQEYIKQTGIPALGDKEDLQATRLWWDVEGDNF